MASGAGSKKKVKGAMDHEQIILQFNQMRQEYRRIVGKIGELEMEVNEHGIVIEALKGVETDRRCFRMIGGVLVERTVKDVLPALENNKEQISGVINKLKDTLAAKEKELTAFKDKHNIHVKGERESQAEDSVQTADKTSGVLVAQDNS
ncbi:prefoldin subunit 2-like [Stylophora pistillata]|uniref:Prefoldin subunit 2 n=1 Tax=Stylophora pistillata TaxID=50429 RepID=A0A2B4SRK5_STYPI|nr:prefoldin subunit 2-like [Stylophora pistillata]PFX32531.1 Prefoldin subunit 2 [Stylophora pistillata]